TQQKKGKAKEPEKVDPETAARRKSTDNLAILAQVVHGLAASQGLAPALTDKNGKPLLSWRVAILPAIDYPGLYQRFKLDEPWDSAHNKKLLAKMPEIYAPVVAGKAKEPYSTFYQVFVSEGAFGGKTPLQIPRDLVDGTSNTFLVVEAGDAVPWTKPVDVEYRADKPVPKLGGLFEQGFHVAIADGDVCFFRKKDQRGKITDAGVKEIVRF